MTLKDRIQSWLGITRLHSLVGSELDKLHSEIRLHNMILARTIAKLEPQFVVDEMDPSRRAASDDIGRKVMAKLRAEMSEQLRYKP